METIERPEWQAETCLTGGYLCGHRHRSRMAAGRCLPCVPRGPGNAGAFSMARVVAMNATAEAIEADLSEPYDEEG